MPRKAIRPNDAKLRELILLISEWCQKDSQHAGDDTALATEFATTYLRLGEMQGATQEAIASFENGRRLLERKSREAPLSPSDSLVLARLRVLEGSTLVDLGQTQEGVANLTAGARLAGSLEHGGWNPEAELVKGIADWRLAHHYRVQLRLREAEEHARAAIDIGDEMVRRGFRTKEVYKMSSEARNVLGGVFRRQGRWQQSMQVYQRVLADTARRAQADPPSAGLQRDLARAHDMMSDMLDRVPGHNENEVRLHVRSAIAISERLAALDPSDKTAQFEFGQYLSNGAESLTRPEDRNEALSDTRRALPIFATLLKSEPGNSIFLQYAALTEADLGDLLGRQRSNRQSIVWLRRGLADMNKLVELDPKNTTNRLEVIKVQRWLAIGLARAGQAPEAMALGRDGIAKAGVVAAEPGASPESWRELPRAYAAMADICLLTGQREEVRKWDRAAWAEWQKMEAKGLYFPESEQEIKDARSGAEGGALRRRRHLR